MAENRAGKAESTHLVQVQVREQRSSVTSLSSLKDVVVSRPPTPMSEDGEKDAGKPPAAKGQRPPKKDAPPTPSGGGRRYAPEPPPDPKQHLFFMAFLNDRTVAEGTKVTKLSCYVQGPDPQPRWFKGVY